jgi:putative dimethyl sulfoxide reductase chaperone
MDAVDRLTTAEVCHLLAVLFYEPKEIFATEAEDLFTSYAPVAAAYDSGLQHLFERLQTVYQHSDLTSLQVDYAALFVGPYELLASPFGSIQLEKDHQLLGETTVMVQQLYQQAGLQVDQEANMVPDHIAVELEFLHYLFTKRAGADDQKLENCLDSFLSYCFRPFAQRLAEKIITHAQTEFYQILGKMLKHVTATIDAVPPVTAQ